MLFADAVKLKVNNVAKLTATYNKRFIFYSDFELLLYAKRANKQTRNLGPISGLKKAL